jgi:lysozyme family protein
MKVFLTVVLAGLFSFMQHTPVPAPASTGSNLPAVERTRWAAAKLTNPDKIDKLIDRYRRTHKTYDAIQAMRKNGVPARVVFALLYRESDNDMTRSPAQGDPLNHRSLHVPHGRIPDKNPPYTFLQAAEDAYYAPELDHLDTKQWTEIGAILSNCELFNGPGYWKRGLVSPYNWSGTNQYSRGKFVADGKFDPMFVDRQMGAAAILKRMEQLHVK